VVREEKVFVFASVEAEKVEKSWERELSKNEVGYTGGGSAGGLPCSLKKRVGWGLPMG